MISHEKLVTLVPRPTRVFSERQEETRRRNDIGVARDQSAGANSGFLGLHASNMNTSSQERLIQLPKGPGSGSLSNVVRSAGDPQQTSGRYTGSRRLVNPVITKLDGQKALPELVAPPLGGSQQVTIEKKAKLSRHRLNSGSLNSR